MNILLVEDEVARSTAIRKILDDNAALGIC